MMIAAAGHGVDSSAGETSRVSADHVVRDRERRVGEVDSRATTGDGEPVDLGARADAGCLDHRVNTVAEKGHRAGSGALKHTVDHVQGEDLARARCSVETGSDVDGVTRAAASVARVTLLNGDAGELPGFVSEPTEAFTYQSVVACGAPTVNSYVAAPPRAAESPPAPWSELLETASAWSIAATSMVCVASDSVPPGVACHFTDGVPAPSTICARRQVLSESVR